MLRQDDSILTDRSRVDQREQRSDNREDEGVVHGYNCEDIPMLTLFIYRIRRSPGKDAPVHARI